MKSETLDEIAAALGITRARACQIRKRAEEMLRADARLAAASAFPQDE
jgi:DNA-directed RNA polymerase sigma subunit (sigma70/sigma32)